MRIHVQEQQWVSNPDILKETTCKQIVTGSTGKTKYQTAKTFFCEKTWIMKQSGYNVDNSPV